MTAPATQVAPRRRFPGLNGIRAIGALFVLTTHVGFHSGAALNSTFNGVLSRLDVGVAIFFVISGFLLFRPHAEGWVRGTARPSTGRYLWHRVLRILPPLWLAIIAAAALLERPDDPITVYLRHVTLTQTYGSGVAAQGLTQMWSLATEVAFYLLLPALAWSLTRRPPSTAALRRRLLLLMATPVVGALWMMVTAIDPVGQRALWLPGYIGWFGLGMAMALWRTGREAGLLKRSLIEEVAAHPGTVWSVALGLYLVAVSPIAGPYSLSQATPGEAMVKSLLYSALGALVVLPTIAGVSDATDPPAVRRLGGRVGTFFGDASYGIFCYHLVVLGVIENRIGYEIFTGGFFRLYVPTLVLSVGVGALSYYCVERPVMRWGRRDEPRPDQERPASDGAATSAVATAASTSS